MMRLSIDGTYIGELALWWIFTSWMAQFTALAACPVGTFGYLCSYTCHCAFDTPCDSNTGSCFGECKPGYTGQPYCQIENIAKGKPTYQETSITDNSALAVDGKRNQTGSDNSCSWSVNFRYPFRTLWRVDLQDVYSVNHIKVYFKNDTNVSAARRTGARVYVTKTEEFHLEPVCYTSHLKGDMFFNPPPLLDLNNCTHRGQFVTLYNQRPVVNSSNCPKTSYSCWANLELCEVEVYVCSYGTFGPNCDRFCHCKGDTCDQRTGVCPKGCLPGWMGSECDMACGEGTYGEDCNSICGHCANGGACDLVTGKCISGCQAGWTGEKCTKLCAQYTFGTNCSGLCFNCANLTDCNKTTGICPLGCADGFYGEQCNNRCSFGTYGKTCKLNCGKCAGAESCNSHTGECAKHCEPGFAMPLCQEPCPDRFYGDNCSLSCGHCMHFDPCHHIYGQCMKGCDPGWSGLHCVTPCKYGTYGYDCANECLTCTDEDCDHVTGECKNGCKPGYQDPKCDRKCPAGLYGSECSQICGQCSDNMTCDPVMGNCPTECSPGWRGTHCNIPCGDGFYGEDCKDMCGHCHNKTACDTVTGKCLIGCEDGFHGLQCRVVNNEEVKVPGGVIGCAVAAVVVIILFAVGCSLRRYKNRKWKNGKTANKATNVNGDGNIIMENEPTLQLQMTDLDSENDYYNIGREIRGIPVSTMKDHLQRMDSNPSRYNDEFEQLRNVPVYPHLAGQKIENKSKNRFLTTFPYDHSRVVLQPIQGETESDYINANYIDSVESRKVYIAAQGPNRLTVRDFWRMIWQEKIGVIVMLANVYEDGKVKCEKYWPEMKPLRYCEVLISLDGSQELSTYTVRHMTVGNVKTSETRKMIQYHFTGWPDHGVPDTMELVEFHRKVMSITSPQRGPLLIHCSAGVGRTGTFIALDALYKYGCKSTHVDIHNFVRKMRECRMTMVQNVEQYKLLHVALLESFSYRHTSICRSEFISTYEQIKHDSKNRLKEEFKVLKNIKPVHSNVECSASLCQENIQKNRALDVLPVDKYRPFLSTHVNDTNDYINAIMIPSCTRCGSYIVTQTPLTHTVVDFWRLLFDHECKTIISLNLLDEEQEETGVWWPSEGESVTYGPLKIKTQSVSDIHDAFTQRTFSIVKRNYGDPRTVRSFHFTKWPVDSKLPVSKHSLLSLLDTVERWKTEIGSDTVVVQCIKDLADTNRNGATCSGLYCGINMVLDNLRLKQEVDVYHAVRKIQSRRSQFVSSVEQYEYMYEVVSEYINSTDIYGNL